MEEDKADPIVNINITSQECLEFASGKYQEKNREQLPPENSAAAQARSNASQNYANTHQTSSPAGNPAVLIPNLASQQHNLNSNNNTTQSSHTPLYANRLIMPMNRWTQLMITINSQLPAP